MKNKIEIFTAGCPVCNPVIELVKETACSSCEITVFDLVEQCEEQVCIDKMKQYNINRLPSVVVNGKLLNCCKSNAITKEDLLAVGVGKN